MRRTVKGLTPGLPLGGGCCRYCPQKSSQEQPLAERVFLRPSSVAVSDAPCIRLLSLRAADPEDRFLRVSVGGLVMCLASGADCALDSRAGVCSGQWHTVRSGTAEGLRVGPRYRTRAVWSTALVCLGELRSVISKGSRLCGAHRAGYFLGDARVVLESQPLVVDQIDDRADKAEACG